MVVGSTLNFDSGLDPLPGFFWYKDQAFVARLKPIVFLFFAGVMATSLHSEPRRLYSWWWDSHISPKNSKWLQENLTDMDSKVKAMIKLIEEDADTFAIRAEMYYKKRPELMKLVEEFYRAYRALAERYDHATVELRQAHRTMEEAFPNQVPYELTDDSPSGSYASGAEPHTPEMSHPVRALFDPDYLQIGLSSSDLPSVKRNGALSEKSDSGIKKRGLKQLNEMFGSGEVVPHNSKHAEGRRRKGLDIHYAEENEQSLQDGFSELSNENQKLKTQVCYESERASKAECEIQCLRKSLAEMQSEKEAVLIQYQQNLENLSNLERKLLCAQKEVKGFDERASKAQTEMETIKGELAKLEAERDAALLQYNQCSEMISKLEAMISLVQEDKKGSSERASRAETEAQNLKQELCRLEAEKEAGLRQYEHSLEKISSLENKIVFAEEQARMLKEQTDKAETEVKNLRQALDRLSEEKEAVALQYKQCLEMVARLENEIIRAQEDAKRLNSEILMGATKLKNTEEQFFLLGRTNQSLRSEVDNLVQKTMMKDQELLEKHEELEKLQIRLQDEHSQFLQVEASFLTSQKLHTQSQEQQTALAMELRNGLQMLKDLEVSKHGLEEEIGQVKEQNQCLNELNLSSTTSIQSMQNEITKMREIKEKLEEEVERQVDQGNALEREISSLKDEIQDLNRRYQALMEQVESVGLPPECFGSSVKELHDENLKLKDICKEEKEIKEALSKKLENMEKLLEKNAISESSLLDMSRELERSKEKVEALQESFQFLQGEKSTLVAEKAALFCHLQVITENLQKLLEKNTLLENSLAGANVELEGLREKSKSLEGKCQFLSSEKSNLLVERSSLVCQLKNVERRLEKLESRFTELESKCAGLEKEKKITLCQVEELRVSMGVEKQEHTMFTKSSDSRLAALENQFCLLQEESRLRKNNFDDEFDKAVNAQVEIFILQNFIQDLEEKNLSLLIDFQKHVEASKLSDKLISELESENLEQQMEAEFLFEEIEKLGTGISRVFKALQIDPSIGYKDKTEQHHAFVPLILDRIQNMKYAASENEDENQRLLVENLVLVTLIGQLKSEVVKFESQKKTLDQEFKFMKDQFVVLQSEKHKLLEMNTQLRLAVSKGDHHGKIFEAENESLHLKLEDLKVAYLELQEKNSRLLEENRSLLNEFSDLKEKRGMLEDENSAILQEAITFSNLSLIFKRFGVEKASLLKTLAEDLDSLHGVNNDLEEEVRVLGEKFELKETENRLLKESVEEKDKQLNEVRDLNDQLNCQILIGKESLIKKETELSETKQELKATQNINKEFCRTVETLNRECEESKLMGGHLGKEIVELSKGNNNLTMEIEGLHDVNGRLESELGDLHEEIKKHRIREENLSSELQVKSNEFELWEAEAGTFYFDLQFSSIREVLLETKVLELTGNCESLEQESASKSMEIEKMKENMSVLEREIGGLKADLSAYAPLIVSIRDDIASLEHNALSRAKIIDIQESKDMEVDVNSHEKKGLELAENQGTMIPVGISDLQKMQCRIKAVEKAVLEVMERHVKEESLDTDIKLEAVMKEIEELKSKRTSRKERGVQKEENEFRDETSDDLNLQKVDDPEISEARNDMMKDIPLDHASDSSFSGTIKRGNGGTDDQMMDLWETAEQHCTPYARVRELLKQTSASMEDDIVGHQSEIKDQKSENPSSELQVEKELGIDKQQLSMIVREPSKEGHKRKILERLASDAQKLMSIQIMVQDLRGKTGTNKKSKKAKDVEYGTAKEQLQEVEEATVQLMDINGQLTKNIEKSPSFLDSKASADLEEAGNVQRKRILEQARRGSEKIARLQLELQKIQYVLLKLEEEDKKSKAKNRFSKIKTSIILKNFIHSGRRSGRRRKKACFCGCLRSSTNETEMTS